VGEKSVSRVNPDPVEWLPENDLNERINILELYFLSLLKYVLK